MLILIAGLPGSGKTTLARALSTQIGALHLNSDLLRRELGLMGSYRPADKEQVYRALLDRARSALSKGQMVVVDSTFYKESVRAPFRSLAADCRVALHWAEVRAQEASIRERMKTPRTDSEADFAVYEKVRDESEPLQEPHLVLWSDQMPLDQMVAAIVEQLQRCFTMTSESIQSIVSGQRFPGEKTDVKWLETHISWVILTPEFAFKIKKPVRFPFLDFSTFEKRAFYCQEEVRLNRRLAPDMYLDVLPIFLTPDGCLSIGTDKGLQVEKAIRMKRMDDRRQMDRLLHQQEVTPGDMEALAAVLARFHRSVVMPASDVHYHATDNRADFEDLFRLKSECVQLFGPDAAPTLERWRKKVAQLLDQHEPRLRARAASGFWVDGHGDLHARNIFLLPNAPVVFDCIEFNPHFRKLDVLNELAFLCMDLDAGGRHELGKVFMNAYLRDWRCIETPEDEQLFRYFKSYRANVRLKVALTEWQQHPSEALEKTARVYWDLLERYLYPDLSDFEDVQDLFT